jgi:hypothetical protein
MAIQVHRAAWISRGFMTFTVANGQILHLGGSSQTAPTAHISGNVSDATGFLATGIPMNSGASGFADIMLDPKGHMIKHARVTLVGAGATTPAARVTSDRSTATPPVVSVPTTSLGAQFLLGDTILMENSRQEIFDFKLFNRSGGNATVEVEVFE